jgi:hypothetical protein
MKKICLICLLALSCSFAFCQGISITGTVKDQQGEPVPLAFIRDAQHFYATFADSTGRFLLKADPASTLVAIAGNYADTRVKIDSKAVIDIIMVKGVSSSKTSAPSSALGNSDLSTFLNKQTLVSQAGSSTAIRAGFNQEATKGSPYLFANWLHGFAIGNADSLLYDINNLYNYDKISGNLVFTNDFNSIKQVEKQEVKQIKLFDGKLYPHVFERSPSLNNKPFTEIIVNTPKYKVYKQTDTKLVRADFHTDGVIESGHRYDEYQDAVHYYFLKQPDGKPRQISLKKKIIKEIFMGDADKFIEAQGSRNIDDDYLRDLNNSLINN